MKIVNKYKVQTEQVKYVHLLSIAEDLHMKNNNVFLEWDKEYNGKVVDSISYLAAAAMRIIIILMNMSNMIYYLTLYFYKKELHNEKNN